MLSILYFTFDFKLCHRLLSEPSIVERRLICLRNRHGVAGNMVRSKKSGANRFRKKPEKTGSKLLFFGVVQILGAEDEISKNVLESPFQELSNNSSTVSVPLQEQNPGRRPGRAFL